MSKFFQHHDDSITIKVDDLMYTASLEEFTKAIGIPYDLPQGYISSYYEPGISHYMVKEENLVKWDPSNRVYLEPIWPKGDLILSKIDTLINDRNNKIQAEIEKREALKKEYLERQEADPGNPLARYTNFLQSLQSSGLMDKLSASKNMAALTTLILNSGILFDDEKIRSSIELIIQGLDKPLTEKDKTLFNSILSKNEFDFTV